MKLKHFMLSLIQIQILRSYKERLNGTNKGSREWRKKQNFYAPVPFHGKGINSFQ